MTPDGNFNFDKNNLTTSAETGFPRVSTTVYSSTIIIYLCINVSSASCRTINKLKRNAHLEPDDAFLFLAIISSIGALITAWMFRDLIYLQMELVLGMRVVEIQDLDLMLQYFKWYNASSVLTWLAVYSVKFSFMFFFRKLVQRVWSLEIYWWVIVGILIPVACFACFFGFFICSDFSINYLATCSVESLVTREEIYLNVTTTLDIFTDVLVMSLPIILLTKVTISLKRKLLLAIALCLSIFMVIIAIIRIALCKLPGGIVDSTWLCLWQGAESCTAIFMVSMTELRSLYSQASISFSGQSTPRRNWWPSSLKELKRTRKQTSSDDNYHGLPDLPQRAMRGIREMIRHGGSREDAILVTSEDDRGCVGIFRGPPTQSSIKTTISSDKDITYHPCH